MMRKVLLIAAVLIVIPFNVQAMNTYRVGDVIVGREYNDALDKWFDRNYDIWIGVNDRNIEFIFFKAETGLGTATVGKLYNLDLRTQLEGFVQKAIEWAKVAKKNKADTTKGIGCFGPVSRDRLGSLFGPATRTKSHTDSCNGKSFGEAYEQDQIGFKFFATNNGQQTNLIISLIDRENQFIKTTIYLDFPAMIKLQENIKLIDEALEKARATAQKQDLFK